MNGHGLPEPAMQLWRDYGDLLRRELGPLGAANWQLGGGTVLAKDWHHRRSFDLDITIATTVDSRKTRRVYSPAKLLVDHRRSFHQRIAGRGAAGTPASSQSPSTQRSRFDPELQNRLAQPSSPPGEIRARAWMKQRYG